MAPNFSLQTTYLSSMCARTVTSFVGVLAFLYAFLVSPPLPYPESAVLKVEPGQSITSVAEELKELGAIRSTSVFKVFSKLAGGVQAGWYSLATESTLELAFRVAHGDTGLDPLTITVPEGSTVRDIRERTYADIPKSEEGYLFPDTYHFLPGTPTADIVSRMRARYEEVVAPLRVEIQASGHTENEIVTMASILEKEARLPETRRMVSGILWRRIKIGMPLQVDAVFGYIMDRDTYAPTLDDLKVQSPYNTYLNRGLPPGPINNPGEDAIRAALEPTTSPYLYYLTGKDGTMHYAKTFEEHVANKRFLR